jgi:NAD(P)-dependent dehydrogenase (short-subunit alcohol dehydrogenase family)
MQINGCAAFVSGANRGLGRALVEALLDRGADKVYAAARRIETVHDLAAREPRVIAVQLDITDAEQVDQAAKLAADATLLVNNGGSLAFADPLSGDLQAFESDMRTNFLGTVSMSQAFAPVLEHNGGGAIVNQWAATAPQRRPPHQSRRHCARSSPTRTSPCTGSSPASSIRT